MNLDNIELENFTELSSDEKLLVLSWRNDENVRKWMYNSEIISEKDHVEFIENLKVQKDNIYFLVQNNLEKLGVIYFNKIDFKNKTCFFGLYGSSNSLVKGLGRILEEVSLHYAFNNLKVNKLKLEVFAENVQVRNLHKKYKFIETDSKIINNKEVICMELRNDDYKE